MYTSVSGYIVPWKALFLPVPSFFRLMTHETFVAGLAQLCCASPATKVATNVAKVATNVAQQSCATFVAQLCCATKVWCVISLKSWNANVNLNLTLFYDNF